MRHRGSPLPAAEDGRGRSLSSPETLIVVYTKPDVPKPFYAGLVASGGKVTHAAHILRFMMGWDGKKVADYCKSKGWTWEKVHTVYDALKGGLEKP